MSCLLWIVLQWTLGCMYLFELWFYLHRCPGVGLLDRMVALFLVFKGTSKLFSIVAVTNLLSHQPCRRVPFSSWRLFSSLAQKWIWECFQMLMLENPPWSIQEAWSTLAHVARHFWGKTGFRLWLELRFSLFPGSAFRASALFTQRLPFWSRMAARRGPETARRSELLVLEVPAVWRAPQGPRALP